MVLLRSAQVVLIVSILSLFLFPQNIPMAQQAANTFRSRTELVTVPVVATRGGHHVPRLKKEDFAVLEDGQARDIAFFEEVKPEQRAVQRIAPKDGIYTNEVSGSSAPVSLTIVLMDTLNTPFLEQGNGRKELIKFLAHSVPPGQIVMLAQLRRNGLRVLHDFTTSPDVLIAALKRVNSNLNLGVTDADIGQLRELRGKDDIGNITPDAVAEASIIQNAVLDDLKTAMIAQDCVRTEVTLDAFEQLTRTVGGLPGRKTLLWATGGQLLFPLEAPPAQCRNLFDEYEQMWHQLSSADIAVYPIDLLQPGNPGFVNSGYGTPVRVTSYPGKQGMFTSFAQYTGGNVCSFRNDLDTCFKNAVEDSSAYYLLSYYAKPLEKPGWRKLQVKTQAPGVHLRARSGYFSLGADDDPETRRKLDVALAVISPVEYSGLPFTMQWIDPLGSPNQTKRAFELRVPPNAFTIDQQDGNHFKLNLVVLAQDSSGKIVGDLTQDLEGRLSAETLQKVLAAGMRYHNALAVPTGDCKVRFIIRDALSGRMGTVTSPRPK